MEEISRLNYYLLLLFPESGNMGQLKVFHGLTSLDFDLIWFFIDFFTKLFLFSLISGMYFMIFEYCFENIYWNCVR